MPNTENINKLIAVIRVEDNYFNMAQFALHSRGEDESCKTPSCLCGWANHIQRYDVYGIPLQLDDIKAGGTWLGLNSLQSYELFLPMSRYDADSEPASWMDITRAEAIRTLEGLRDTGIVSWAHTEVFPWQPREEDPEVDTW